MITPEEEALMHLLLRMYSGTRVVKGGMNSAISQGNLNPLSDNAYSLGTSSLRWANVVGNNFTVYHAAGDANPTAQLGDNFLKFGRGGVNAPNVSIAGNTDNSTFAGFNFTNSGNARLSFDILGSATSGPMVNLAVHNNTDYVQIVGSYNSQFQIQVLPGSWPLVFQMGTAEAFRMTTDPYVLFQGFGFGNAAISANTTLTAASKTVQLATGGAGGITVTLPAANAGKCLFIIIKADSGAGAITVAAAGTDTIQGSATKSLSTQYSKIMLQSDGTSTWYDLSSGLV